ncbi:uncharacterized protein AB675_9217 [Cyphellophora attinorum]|uniref:C3H1-type domain-containing protein n=1 Tax=Cyphellophora attinorum TaxID=1664694 RepID=A0A0N1HST0_9EURO|nr:uncharacterized protein AB675_9217 [Phialophora attinorum]KPI41772.1 hypothetical protein AB675_9217 [Phialophora attinorum]
MYWLVVLLLVWLVAAQLSGVEFDHVFDTAFAAVADLSIIATSTVNTYAPTATLTAFAPTPVAHITDILNVIDFSASAPHFLALALGATVYTARWTPAPLIGTSTDAIHYVLPAVRKSLPSLMSTIRAAEASFDIVGSHGDFSKNSASWHNDMDFDVIDWTNSSKVDARTGTISLTIALVLVMMFLAVIYTVFAGLGYAKVLARLKTVSPEGYWKVLMYCASNETRLQLSTLQAEISSLRDAKSDLEKGFKKLTAQMAEKEAELQHLTGKRNALQDEKDRLTFQMAKSSGDTAKLQQRCHELEASITAKDSDIQAIKAAEETAKKSLHECHTRLEKLKQDLNTVKEENKQKGKHNAQLEYKLKVSEKERSSLIGQVSTLQAEKALAEESLVSAKTDRAEAVAAARKLEEANSKLQAKKLKAEASIQEKEAEITAKENECVSLASKLSVKRNELSEAHGEADRLRLQLDKLQAELSTTRKLNETLKKANQSLRAGSDNLQQQLQNAEAKHKLQMDEYKIKKSASQSGQELRKLREEIERLVDSESMWQKEKTAQAAEISRLELLVRELTDAVRELTDAKAAVASVSTAREEDVKRLESEVKKLTDGKTAAETASTAQKAEIKRLESEIKKLTDGKATAENASTAHKEEIGRLESEVKKLTDDKTAAETASTAHEEEVTRLRSEVEMLTREKDAWEPLKKTALADSSRLQNQVWGLEAENKSMLKAGQEQAKAEKKASNAFMQQIQKLEAQVSRLQKQLPSEPSSSDTAISKPGNDSQPSSQIVESEVAEDERIAESSPEGPSQVVSAADELMTPTTITDTIASGTGPTTDIPADSVASRTGSTTDTPADSVASRTGSTTDTPADLVPSRPIPTADIPAKIGPGNHEEVALSSSSDKATAGSGLAQTLVNERPVQSFKLRKIKQKTDPSSGVPICRYYWRNECRYGKNCKNSHDVPSSELYDYHLQSSKNSQNANNAQPSPSPAPRTEVVTPSTQLVNNSSKASQGPQLLSGTDGALTGGSCGTKAEPSSSSPRVSAAASKWATDGKDATASVSGAQDSTSKHSTTIATDAMQNSKAGNFPRVTDAPKTMEPRASLTSGKPAQSKATDSLPTAPVSTASQVAAPMPPMATSGESSNLDTRVKIAATAPATKPPLASSKFASSGTSAQHPPLLPWRPANTPQPTVPLPLLLPRRSAASLPPQAPPAQRPLPLP